MSTTIALSVKMLGKRRAAIESLPLHLPFAAGVEITLSRLLEQVVENQVKTFNERVDGKGVLNYLSPQEVEAAAQHGKVDFGEIHNSEKADLNKAITHALQAYQDGVYLVVIDGEKMEHLNDPLQLKENMEVMFIRLVALAGGYT